MTRNLRLFAAFSIVWSVVFFSILNWALYAPEQRWPVIVIATIIYGLGFGFAGHEFGRRDLRRMSRLNLSMWYGFTSQIASLVIGGLWVLVFRPSEWPTLVVMMVAFSIALVIAYIANRHSIKGIERERLFQ